MLRRTWLCLCVGIAVFAAKADGVQALSAVPAFEWHHELTYTEMVNTAPLIIIGEVRGLVFVGPPVESTDDQGNRHGWQLVKASVSVENVLKGRASDAIEFFFYISLAGFSGDWNSLDVGGRFVFFLKEVDGRLRAVRDHWRSSIEVGSGRHLRIPSAETTQEQIAVLLLSPGQDLIPKQFERVLQRSVPLAIDWTGYCKAIGLLRGLLTNPSLIVRRAAQEQLAVLRVEGCPAASRTTRGQSGK